MTLTKCKACGKEVLKAAKRCSYCDVENPGITGKDTAIALAVLVAVVWMVWTFFADGINQVKNTYPASNASYSELDSEVGCQSKYSDDKKNDIFNSRYKDHWMIWRGELLLVEADSASLNIDGVGIQDLSVVFADKNAGYNLEKGSFIKVKFLMKHGGGCFLPFTGEHAQVVR